MHQMRELLIKMKVTLEKMLKIQVKLAAVDTSGEMSNHYGKNDDDENVKNKKNGCNHLFSLVV